MPTLLPLLSVLALALLPARAQTCGTKAVADVNDNGGRTTRVSRMVVDGVCEACPAGSYSQINALVCTECDPGTSTNAQTGRAECEDCPEGTKATNAGSSECDECDPGTRPIVDTLLDGFQGRPCSFNRERASKSDVCCPTCEVTEFIFA